MIDIVISLLKDENKISNLLIYFVSVIVFIFILKSILKSTKVNPKVFDNIALTICLVYSVLVLGNVLLTENYMRLSYILVAVSAAILQKLLPKFIKWYDRKIDKLSEKM
jgi:hypothetical protein